MWKENLGLILKAVQDVVKNQGFTILVVIFMVNQNTQNTRLLIDRIITENESLRERLNECYDIIIELSKNEN
jgi:hypothetical protein